MHDITVVRCYDTPHQNTRCGAMVEGLEKLGLKVAYNLHRTLPVTTQKVAIWGYRKGEELRRAGHDVLVMELGYVGDRKKYISLGWNGLNGFATFPRYKMDGGRRFRDHGGEIKPWKEAGDYALILGQLPGDSSLRGQDMRPIYQSWADRINIPVLFRHHPESFKRGKILRLKGVEESRGTLEEDLRAAAFSVCFNSNGAVDSVLSGTPCIVFDKGSMAYEVCGHDIGEIIRPSLKIWAQQLAWKQWTLEEIADGIPLVKLLKECP